MKTINVSFEDKEYEKILKVKKEISWREFILNKVKEAEI